MKISTKGRYALRLMVDIAANGQDAPVSLGDVAARQDISMKYLEAITALLVKAELLESVRGARGGYRLAVSADRCTVLDVLTATEGALAPAPCSGREGDCPRAGTCETRAVWDGLFELVDSYLRSVTLKDLMDRKKKKTQQNDVWML